MCNWDACENCFKTKTATLTAIPAARSAAISAATSAAISAAISAATSVAQTLLFYHGTARSNLLSIKATGLRVSPNGQMGSGVYVAQEDKAANFARDASKRGKGDGCVVLKCIITFKNAKFVRHSDNAGNWRECGHDAVRCEITHVSARMEWCLARSDQVRVIAYRELNGGTWVSM